MGKLVVDPRLGCFLEFESYGYCDGDDAHQVLNDIKRFSESQDNDTKCTGLHFKY